MAILIEDFVDKFSAQFENTESRLIKAETNFKQLDEWDSMIALSVIAMTDEDFGVTLTGDDIRKSTTVEDLFNIVCSKS